MGKDGSRQGNQSRGEVKRPPDRRHQFYGRRKGHALRDHQRKLMAELLPRLRIDPSEPKLSAERETWLEIGFGGGEHLAHQAALHSEIDFIGAEPFINGVAKLLAIIEERALSNTRIHDDDVRYLLEALPDEALGRIYLLYPDPWPKVRHQKRRLVNEETIGHFHRLLSPGGSFIFASDMPDYVEWAVSHMRDHGGFALASISPEAPENWVQTRYEAKAVKDGRAPCYLRFEKIGQGLRQRAEKPISRPT
jgi:tRNA (guanine-N7-)-methyltransferase